jgi:hypothetical protein
VLGCLGLAAKRANLRLVRLLRHIRPTWEYWGPTAS